MIIGITGTIGAGKGVLVEYLKEKGFKHYSAREFLLNEMDKRGLEHTRENARIVADDLRSKYSPQYIIEELYKEASQNEGDAVIESVRALGEVDFLKAHNVYIFGVDADPEIRYKRVVERNGDFDNVTFEDFIGAEKKEDTASDPNRGNLSGALLRSDYVFKNNGTVDELYSEVDKVLKNMSKKNSIYSLIANIFRR